MTLTQEISKVFAKQAHAYEAAAKVQQEIGDRLLERLQYLNIKPKYILDLGCGTGLFSKKLTSLYPKACIVGVDLVPDMLQMAQKKQGFLRKWPLTAADMKHLPFADGTFDLVFSNQALHWSYPLGPVFRELSRVMNIDACLMFTTLGPDTFQELKQAWSAVDRFAHTNDFIDMHDVGDALMGEHFVEPVVDMEVISVLYPKLRALVQALKDQGVRNIHADKNRGLTGKVAWKLFEQAFEGLKTEAGKYPLTYEVVYGHAWKGAMRQTGDGVETFVPISQIRGLRGQSR